jgi:hypothetical protein
MLKKTDAFQKRWISSAFRLSGTWFFAGMPLSMLVSVCYFMLALPPPALFFFLTSFVYLNGAFLGSLWSIEHLLRADASSWDRIGAVLVLGASFGFLTVGIAFALIGMHHW